MGIPSSSEDNARKVEEAAFMDKPMAADLAALLAAPKGQLSQKGASRPRPMLKPTKAETKQAAAYRKRQIDAKRLKKQESVAWLQAEVVRLKAQVQLLQATLARQADEKKKLRR